MAQGEEERRAEGTRRGGDERRGHNLCRMWTRGASASLVVASGAARDAVRLHACCLASGAYSFWSAGRSKTDDGMVPVRLLSCNDLETGKGGEEVAG